MHCTAPVVVYTLYYVPIVVYTLHCTNSSLYTVLRTSTGVYIIKGCSNAINARVHEWAQALDCYSRCARVWTCERAGTLWLVCARAHCTCSLHTWGVYLQEICTVQPVHVPVPLPASVAFPSFSVLRTPSQRPPGGCPLHPECCPEPWPVPGH